MNKIISALLAVVVALTLSCVAEASEERNAAFESFLKNFKFQVFTGDTENLAKSIHFPLEGSEIFSAGQNKPWSNHRQVKDNFIRLFDNVSRVAFYNVTAEKMTDGTYSAFIVLPWYERVTDSFGESAIVFTFDRIDGAYKLLRVTMAG